MNISRNVTLKIAFVLDQLLPPLLRDSKLFMNIPFHLLFGKKNAEVFMEFKNKAPYMTEMEFSNIYNSIDNAIIQRETDLNTECIERILKDVSGDNVLEVGCGRAYLANLIQKKGFNIIGADIYISNEIKDKFPNIEFTEQNIEKMNFADGAFDTVICTHTLEHVQDFHKSVAELRRVAAHKLIIVVPCQRPYKYTFDLHLRFFPYAHSFLNEIKPKTNAICEVIGGDIYYVETN